MNDPSAPKLIHVWSGALPRFPQCPGLAPSGPLVVDSTAMEFSCAGVWAPHWRVQDLDTLNRVGPKEKNLLPNKMELKWALKSVPGRENSRGRAVGSALSNWLEARGPPPMSQEESRVSWGKKGGQGLRADSGIQGRVFSRKMLWSGSHVENSEIVSGLREWGVGVREGHFLL